jgi:hypothetical protein
MTWLHKVGLIEDKIFETLIKYIEEESQTGSRAGCKVDVTAATYGESRYGRLPIRSRISIQLA